MVHVAVKYFLHVHVYQHVWWTCLNTPTHTQWKMGTGFCILKDTIMIFDTPVWIIIFHLTCTEKYYFHVHIEICGTEITNDMDLPSVYDCKINKIKSWLKMVQFFSQYIYALCTSNNLKSISHDLHGEYSIWHLSTFNALTATTTEIEALSNKAGTQTHADENCQQVLIPGSFGQC